MHTDEERSSGRSEAEWGKRDSLVAFWLHSSDPSLPLLRTMPEIVYASSCIWCSIQTGEGRYGEGNSHPLNREGKGPRKLTNS